MGAGKTVVGRLVARELGRPLVDVDAAILERTGSTTRELWEQGGEAAYRPLERAITIEALRRERPTVIGVPAGVAMDPAGQHLLDQTTVAVVWLRARVPTLVARIAAQHHRPLVDDDPAELLAEQAAVRSPVYERLADLILDVDERPPAELAAAIVALVRSDRPRRPWPSPPGAAPWPDDHRATEFQRKTAALVAAVEPGDVATYGEIAAAAGRPGAAQAVANVLRRAPGLPWWRIVPADGRLYRTHEPTQRALLEAEGHQIDDDRRIVAP